jgi:hypothetical protein
MKKKFPSWIKGTPEGALYVDTTNIEWKEFFTNFIIKHNERSKKFIKKLK